MWCEFYKKTLWTPRDGPKRERSEIKFSGIQFSRFFDLEFAFFHVVKETHRKKRAPPKNEKLLFKCGFRTSHFFLGMFKREEKVIKTRQISCLLFFSQSPLKRGTLHRGRTEIVSRVNRLKKKKDEKQEHAKRQVQKACAEITFFKLLLSTDEKIYLDMKYVSRFFIVIHLLIIAAISLMSWTINDDDQIAELFHLQHLWYLAAGKNGENEFNWMTLNDFLICWPSLDWCSGRDWETNAKKPRRGGNLSHHRSSSEFSLHYLYVLKLVISTPAPKTLIKDRPAYANEGSFISLKAYWTGKLREQSHDLTLELLKEKRSFKERRKNVKSFLESIEHYITFVTLGERERPLNAFWNKKEFFLALETLNSLISFWAAKCRLWNISQFV